MKKAAIILSIAIGILVFGSCTTSTGDVIVAADGRIVEGQLQTIGSGRAVFADGSVEIPDMARVWCINGKTFEGAVTVASGVVQSGSSSVSMDSVYMIIWGNTDIVEETFSVDAALGWLNTGIELERGEIISLLGAGTVVTETGVSTPDGQDKFSSSVSLAPGATSGQLVFRVGETGQSVAAGSNWVGESPSEGSLFLAVNVPLEGSSDARGVYSVSVKAGTNANRTGVVVFYPARR